MKANKLPLGAIAVLVGGCLMSGGCASLMKSQGEPIERFATTMVTEAVAPAIEKALEEGNLGDAILQGQASAINPGLVFKTVVIYGTCVVIEGEIGTEGVSANLAGAGSVDGDAG